jgi:hypothetical protein
MSLPYILHQLDFRVAITMFQNALRLNPEACTSLLESPVRQKSVELEDSDLEWRDE